jgi:hypothetical protein
MRGRTAAWWATVIRTARHESDPRSFRSIATPTGAHHAFPSLTTFFRRRAGSEVALSRSRIPANIWAFDQG